MADANDEDKKEQLYAMRHSMAHILATAIQIIWPTAKFGVGPVIDNGFYYDVDLGDITLSEDDLPKIEAKMKEIIASNDAFERFEKTIDEAIEWAEQNQQPYKVELLRDLQRAGTTDAHKLSTEEMGTITEDGTSQVQSVSFTEMVHLQTYVGVLI